MSKVHRFTRTNEEDAEKFADMMRCRMPSTMRPDGSVNRPGIRRAEVKRKGDGWIIDVWIEEDE